MLLTEMYAMITEAMKKAYEDEGLRNKDFEVKAWCWHGSIQLELREVEIVDGKLLLTFAEEGVDR